MNLTPLQWSEHLRLDHGSLDEMNHTLMTLLAQAHVASDEILPQAWSALLKHTRQHFACEDAWMRRTHFAAAEQHQLQHRMVLHVLREGQVLADQGQAAAVREMALEMAAWFTKHTRAQDTALVQHLRRVPPPAAG